MGKNFPHAKKSIFWQKHHHSFQICYGICSTTEDVDLKTLANMNTKNILTPMNSWKDHGGSEQTCKVLLAPAPGLPEPVRLG